MALFYIYNNIIMNRMAHILKQLNDIICWDAYAIPNDTHFDHFCTLIKQNPGIDLNMIYDGHEPLLITAVNMWGYKYIPVLVANGANIDYVDRSQNNALLNASVMPIWNVSPTRVSQCYQTIKCLLECGADCNSRGDKGRTALMNICRFSMSRIIDDIDDIDDIDQYSIHNIIDLLISYGADRDLVDKQGQTAEQLARLRRNNNDDVADYVRDCQPLPDVKGCYE